MRINNHSVEAPNNVGMKVNELQTKSFGRVNINNLMSKIRADYKKKRKFSFCWFDWFHSSYNWNYCFFIISKLRKI